MKSGLCQFLNSQLVEYDPVKTLKHHKRLLSKDNVQAALLLSGMFFCTVFSKKTTI